MESLDWELISFVERSKHRKTILKHLTRPKTPSQIKSEKGIHFNSISRALIELEKKGLVKCLSENQKKARFYCLSEKGKEILEAMKKFSEDI